MFAHTPNKAFAIWSPHRDSHSVMVWKSWVSMRQEPWFWCNEVEEANWILVDATRGVPLDLTVMLHLHQAEKSGILLARDFSDVPDTIWKFFRIPLHAKLLNQWLDHVIHNKHAGEPLDKEWVVKNLLSSLENQYLRLNRWVNLTQYGKFSLDMAPICIRLLNDYVPITEVIRHPKLCEHEIRKFLQNCFAEGALDYRSSKPDRLRSASHFNINSSAHFVSRTTKRNLIQRIFARFL